MAGTVLRLQKRDFSLALILCAAVLIIIGTIAVAGPAVHTALFVANAQ